MLYAELAPAENRLLTSLPPEDQALLAPFIRLEQPPRGQVLSRRTEPATDAWFPHAGIIALTVTDVSGRGVQTGVIGPEGCLGLEALFGNPFGMPDASVQIDGPMSVVPLFRLRWALQVRPALRSVLARSVFALTAQALQTVACNRLHSLASRCCRWLLTLQDGAMRDDLPLTQDNLATLLGGGRPRVNQLLAGLERRGILRRYRGRIRLLKRSGLERQACECYGVTRAATGTPDAANGWPPTVTHVTDM